MQPADPSATEDYNIYDVGDNGNFIRRKDNKQMIVGNATCPNNLPGGVYVLLYNIVNLRVLLRSLCIHSRQDTPYTEYSFARIESIPYCLLIVCACSTCF
jgi:hypothetical protein